MIYHSVEHLCPTGAADAILATVGQLTPAFEGGSKYRIVLLHLERAVDRLHIDPMRQCGRQAVIHTDSPLYKMFCTLLFLATSLGAVH
ncbi:hypothetical protein D3C87_1813370 [compost metagenome]